MIGFVSALSSAVAVMIVLMSALLFNKMKIEEANDKLANSFLFLAGEAESGHHDNGSAHKGIVGETVFSAIDSFVNAGHTKLRLRCAYSGGGEQLAMNLYAFNYILLSKKYEGIMKEPFVEDVYLSGDGDSDGCFVVVAE